MKIEGWIHRYISLSKLPEAFDVTLTVHKNALTFDLIDEKDIKNISTVINELIIRIQHDAASCKKDRILEKFQFPLGIGETSDRVLLSVEVRYRLNIKWAPTVTVEKEH